MKNISTNNVDFTLTIGAVPIKITHFSAESDFWVKSGDVELGGSERTADGKMVVFAKNGLYKYTLTLSGASKEAETIMGAFYAQSKNGNLPSVLLPINAVCITDSYVCNYIGGVIESGPVMPDFGNQKILDYAWTFSFDKVAFIPK